MKKLLTFALCLAAVGSMSAQKENVKLAQKNAGKIDKVAEARAAIKQALSNPETANDPQTFFVASEIETKGYDAMKKKLAIDPASVDKTAMYDMLLTGYDYLMKAANADATGKVKGQVAKTLAVKAPEYFTAGAEYFNSQHYYPQAYNAFMTYAGMSDVDFLKGFVNIPDSIAADAYYNAGMAAYYNPEPRLDLAADAFKKARLAGYKDAKVYIFELASWQNIMSKDESMTDAGRRAILEVSKAGYDKFGTSQPIFLNNMVNVYADSEQYDEALKLIDSLLGQGASANLYALKAFVNGRKGNLEGAVDNYRKAAAMPDADYEILKNSARMLYRNGTEEWNSVDIKDPQYQQKRDAIRADFNNTLEIARRAKSLVPEGQSSADIDNTIEDIEYAISLIK